LRDIGKFSFAFMVGNFIILFTICVVVFYCLKQIELHKGLGPNLSIFDPASYLTTVGFAIYSFEGIGIVIPIMQTVAEPQKFDKILNYAVLTFSLIFIRFENLCYFTFGSDMDKPLIKEMLPP
jgi:amino acid permease